MRGTIYDRRGGYVKRSLVAWHCWERKKDVVRKSLIFQSVAFFIAPRHYSNARSDAAHAV
jgi:hypothetical protein